MVSTSEPMRTVVRLLAAIFHISIQCGSKDKLDGFEPVVFQYRGDILPLIVGLVFFYPRDEAGYVTECLVLFESIRYTHKPDGRAIPGG
jgi:hypothetical protein